MYLRSFALHQIELDNVEEFIRARRQRLGRDKTLKDGVGISLYKTQIASVWVLTVGVLDKQMQEALSLSPHVENALPFKIAAVED